MGTVGDTADMHARAPRVRRLLALLAGGGALAARALAAAGAAPARAEACPGAGAGACPYASRADPRPARGGRAALPRGRRGRPAGGRVRRRPARATWCRRSTRRARCSGEWGSYGGGRGQFGAIGGLATDTGGNVYVVDSSHNRIEKFDSTGNFLARVGAQGLRTSAASSFGSSPDYEPAAGRRHRGGRQLRVRGRLAATTASSAST